MPGGAGCQAEATGPTRRQGTHHPPPNRLTGETNSTTDEEPCRPHRRGESVDRRVPHTRRSSTQRTRRSLRSPHTLGLQREIEALASFEGFSPQFSWLNSIRPTNQTGRCHNRFKPFIRTDPFYRYNPDLMHDPCHSSNRYNRYNQTSRRNAFCERWLRCINPASPRSGRND